MPPKFEAAIQLASVEQTGAVAAEPLPIAEEATERSDQNYERAWTLIERFLPAAVMVVAVALTLLVVNLGESRISPIAAWASLPWSVRVTGIFCPLVAVSICASQVGMPYRHHVLGVLAAASVAAPFIGLAIVRSGVQASFTGGIPVAAVMAETLLTVPLIWSSSFAFVLTMSRTSTRSRWTRTGILTAVAFVCVLINANGLRGLVAIADGRGTEGFGLWLLDQMLIWAS